jgi:hypothetical protein
MIEMLAVLAIVGVLSIGALAGYSMAMSNHKVCMLANDIKRTVMGIQEIYATMPSPRDHTIMDRDFLIDEGLLPADYSDPWGGEIKTLTSVNTVMFKYDVKDPAICRKLLSSSSFQEIGDYLSFLVVGSTLVARAIGGSTDNPFPMTMEEISTVCGEGELQYRISIAIYIKGLINYSDYRSFYGLIRL